MIIDRLEIKGFGKLNNLGMNFKQGVNIVFGKNESGKTSIQWFIKGMLFGLKGGKAAKDGTPPPNKKFKPWRSGEFTGVMEYRLDDGTAYRIGRNFANNTTRVFDSLFNDITATFDITKEKGVAFAEKHLGLNEACFDRTVFIRQMEAVIDEDGSKELLNRLINVSQTGFEDISFKKAQEALKEALKTYIGTDKTTTRPLDRIMDRMDELKAAKQRLVLKRDSLFSVEEELKNAVQRKGDLESKKVVLSKLNEYICLKINSKSVSRLMKEIQEILQNIIKEEEELQLTGSKLTEFNKIKEEYQRFGVYDNDDIDAIEREYQRLLSLHEENGKLQRELDRKKEQIGKLKSGMVPEEEASKLSEDLEEKVRTLDNELQYLYKERNRKDEEEVKIPLQKTDSKEKLYGRLLLLTFIFAILSGGTILINQWMGMAGGLVFSALTVLFYLKKRREGKKASEENQQQLLTTKQSQTVRDEINHKEAALKDIFRMAGVETLEEFLVKKVERKNSLEQLKEGTQDIERMEAVVELNRERLEGYRRTISERLMKVGIEFSDSLEINEKGIREFKYGIRMYKGNEPSLVYTHQRIEDLTKGLNKYYQNASSISGTECRQKEDMGVILSELESEYRGISEEIEKCSSGIGELIKKEGFLKLYFANLSEEYIEENLNEIRNILDNEENKIDEEIKSSLLDMKELETELKYQPLEDEEMQRVEEELEFLNNKKNQLEDINISLKTALDVMTEASMEIQRDFVPVLNQKMSEIISKISIGRYVDLRADDKLVLKTISPETGDVVQSVLLSGGTIDQMYLALRVAMSEILTEGKECLPLILDEVFSQYDDERTAETFRFFQQVSEEKQIIFFTCKAREVELAKGIFGDSMNLIELASQ